MESPNILNQMGILSVMFDSDILIKSERSRISFDLPFTEIPSVRVSLSKLETNTERNTTVRAKVENITTRGCEIIVESWNDSQTWNVDVCWLATNDPLVKVGAENITGLSGESRDDNKNKTSQNQRLIKVNFDEEFDNDRTPQVSAAIYAIDTISNTNIRLWIDIKEITRQGFTIYIATWLDSYVISAGISWIATTSPHFRLLNTTTKFREMANEILRLGTGERKISEELYHDTWSSTHKAKRTVCYISGLKVIDAGNCARMRVKVEAKHRMGSANGCDITATTWLDSKTNGVEAEVVGALCNGALQRKTLKASYIPTTTATSTSASTTILLPPDYSLIVCDGVFSSHETVSSVIYHAQNKWDRQGYSLKRFKNTNNTSNNNNINTTTTSRSSSTSKTDIDTPMILSWMRQIFDGLAHIHMKMTHGEINGSNIILLDSKGDARSTGVLDAKYKYGQIKIINLCNIKTPTAPSSSSSTSTPSASMNASSSTASKRMESSRCYYSPERLEDGEWDTRDDVWATTCLMTELVTHKRLQNREGGYDFGLRNHPNSIKLRRQVIKAVLDNSPQCHMIAVEVLTKLFFRKVSKDMVQFTDDVIMNISPRPSNGNSNSTLSPLQSRRRGSNSNNNTLSASSSSSSSSHMSPTRVISGSWDDSIRIWDITTKETVRTLEGHSDDITCVCVNDNGTRIVSGSTDNTIRVWDILSGVGIHILTEHTNWVTSVAVSSDGSKIISASADHSIKMWNMYTGSCICTYNGHTNWASAVDISTDMTTIVSGSADKSVRVWDVGTGSCSCVLNGHTVAVTSVCINSDGTRVISASDDYTIKIWDVLGGLCERTLEGHTGVVNSICISHDGLRIVSGSWDNTIKVWNASTGVLELTLEGHTNFVRSVSISADGTKIASASLDDTIKIWDFATGTCDSTLMGHKEGVSAVVFCADPSRTSTSTQNGERVEAFKLQKPLIYGMLMLHEIECRGRYYER
eukprot:gene9981-20756_t